MHCTFAGKPLTSSSFLSREIAEMLFLKILFSPLETLLLWTAEKFDFEFLRQKVCAFKVLVSVRCGTYKFSGGGYKVYISEISPKFAPAAWVRKCKTSRASVVMDVIPKGHTKAAAQSSANGSLD